MNICLVVFCVLCDISCCSGSPFPLGHQPRSGSSDVCNVYVHLLCDQCVLCILHLLYFLTPAFAPCSPLSQRGSTVTNSSRSENCRKQWQLKGGVASARWQLWGIFGDFNNFSKFIVGLRIGVPCSVDSVIMAFKVDTKSFTQSLSNT